VEFPQITLNILTRVLWFITGTVLVTPQYFLIFCSRLRAAVMVE
jgi:hypothetical protein